MPIQISQRRWRLWKFHRQRLLQACVNLYTDPIELAHWSPYWKALKWGMFLYFSGDISLFHPCYEGKELPWPICEPGRQLCDCSEHRAEHQLASTVEYLWIWDMPSTVVRHGVLAESKHGQTKPMSACRIPRSSISFIIPFTIWFPVWLQLVLFSPVCQLSPAISCLQQPDCTVFLARGTGLYKTLEASSDRNLFQLK